MADLNYDFLSDVPPDDDHEEMAKLLELINAEWKSDPMSVQCFDERIIARVRAALRRHEDRKKRVAAELARYEAYRRRRRG